MSIDGAAVRREFPALERWTYFNTATYGLVPARVMTLAESARDRLHRLGAEPSVVAGLPSPIVAVRFPGRDPSALVRALKERHVLVAARHGGLRVSPHFYNDESDLDRLEEELRRTLEA